jgi:hypothetical protein
MNVMATGASTQMIDRDWDERVAEMPRDETRREETADNDTDDKTGRMMPIDPGVGPGGTTGNTDVSSGGGSMTEWGGGTITAGRAGVVDPDDDTPLNEKRNDARDPGAADSAESRPA